MSLLLSPEVIDFALPVVVTINGIEVFRGTVEREVATLIEWWMVDQDRTMMYAAELVFSLFPEGWILTSL